MNKHKMNSNHVKVNLLSVKKDCQKSNLHILKT